MVNTLEKVSGNMNFNHLNYDMPVLHTKNINGKRFYDCGDKFYPSITTILSADPKK